MRKNLLELQSMLRDNGILISFSGRFSQGIIEELGEAVKKHMEAEERPKNDIFNVFAIFIEQTQNIKNYSASKENSDSFDKIANSGIVNIVKSGSGYSVWSGNLIENSDVEELAEKLAIIKSLDKDGLKKMYREQIKKEVPKAGKSAGLGLIDIARKAKMPIEYTIEKLDEKFSFYEIRVMV